MHLAQRQSQWIDKLSQFKKLQKTIPLCYTILKTLNQSFEQDQMIPIQPIFQQLIKYLPKQIKKLNLYKQLIYQIWLRDNYPIKIRQQCSQQILKSVTQWIMEFQVKVDNLNTVGQKFKLISEYLIKNCESMAMSLLIIDEVFEDLKDLFDKSFWNLPQQNLQTYNQFTFIVESDPEAPQQVIWLLQTLFIAANNQQKNQQIEIYLSDNAKFVTDNYSNFIYQCINFLLCLELNQSFQCQVTKLALQFIRSRYCIQNQQKTIKLFKRLMIRTKKGVRYALVQQYIQTYEFFQKINCDRIIQQLQDIIYFRQLIIGHSKAQKIGLTKNLQQNIAQNYFSSIFIKAGSKQRIYFSIEDCQYGILKLDLHLEQGMNINLRFYHLNNSAKQIPYHEQLKTQLRKLDLAIKYSGLYAIQFDNSYSWIHGKNIMYHLHVMKKIDSIQNIILLAKQKRSPIKNKL